VEEDKEHRFVKWSKNYEELNACGELIGIHKVSNQFFKEVCCEFERNLAQNEKSSYEPFFQKVSNTTYPIYILKVDDLVWYEIDDEADLKFAEEHIQ
jgi:2-aminoethylphosphonate-pyruvate transaminase